jgi:hypothetical protein
MNCWKHLSSYGKRPIIWIEKPPSALYHMETFHYTDAFPGNKATEIDRERKSEEIL